MRIETLAAMVLLSVAVAGADDDPARLVLGKWTLDAKLSAETQARYEDATPEQLESLSRKIAAAAPDATFEFTKRTYSFGWTGQPVQKGTYLFAMGNKTPGHEVIGLTIQPEGADPDSGETDMISIQMRGADVMQVSLTGVPYDLALRRVK